MKDSLQILRFNTGEIAPFMTARTDTGAYAASCLKMENFIPSVQGHASRRGGTRFLGEVKDSSKKTRLFPFQVSSKIPYLLEFGAGYIRFYIHRLPILNDDTTPYEVSTLYTEDDLPDIKTAQSGDVLYIVHPSHPMRRLIRVAATQWTLSDADFIDGPYLPVNTGDVSLTPSGTTGTVTVTASADLFCGDDVGRHIRLRHTPSSTVVWGAGIITGFTNARTVAVKVFDDFPFASASATKAWRLGVFNAKDGYASCVDFFEQRLILAKNNCVYASCVGKYETFSPTDRNGAAAADLGFGCEIASQQINDICWLSSGRALSVGTTGADFTLTTSSNITLTSSIKIDLVRHSTFGSESVTPVKISNTTLFVQRYGRKVRAFAYDLNADGYTARDVTILAPHITQSGICDMTLQQEPVPVVWCALNNGNLIGMTYDGEQNVQAWHRHPMTNGFVESLTTLPKRDGNGDELYLIVRRVVDGRTKRYIEVMETGLAEDAEDTTDAFFVDSGLSLHAVNPVQTVSGLAHLEGQTVAILADGAVQPEKTVSDGTVVLDKPAKTVHVGLPFSSVLQPTAAAGLTAPARDRKIRIVGAVLRLYKTLGFSIGTAVRAEAPVFRTFADVAGKAPALFSGCKKVAFTGDWDDMPVLSIKQEQPLPLTVLAVYPLLTSNHF